MSENRFKTMRHIETVRNYLQACIGIILTRATFHDQSKLEPPEAEIFEKYTDKLRDITYGSTEYFKCIDEMKPALDSHYSVNRHHPEHHSNGIEDMDLIDLLEMICDWKAAGMRHNDGDMINSIEYNQKRFGYGDELKQIFLNTANTLDREFVYHKAEES